MLSATLERPPNGWRSIGPYLRPDNPETAALLAEKISEDQFDAKGRVDYAGIFFADVYHHLWLVARDLAIQITVDGRLMTVDELYEASL